MPAVADEPQPDLSSPAFGTTHQGDTRLVSPLALWPYCSTPQRLARVKPICVDDDLVGIKLENQFLALLRSTKGDIETLCEVDTIIVRSLEGCVVSHPGTPEAIGTAAMLSPLEITVAQAWRKRGELQRADALYLHFFEGYGKWWLHEQQSGRYLKEWATVKRMLSEWDAARDLAGRYVVFERGMYDCDRSFLPSLVKSLEIQFAILISAHDTEQAAQVRKELERLAAIADEHCIDGVCRGCIEGVCYGSPEFDGTCLRYLKREE